MQTEYGNQKPSDVSMSLEAFVVSALVHTLAKVNGLLVASRDGQPLTMDLARAQLPSSAKELQTIVDNLDDGSVVMARVKAALESLAPHQEQAPGRPDAGDPR